MSTEVNNLEVEDKYNKYNRKHIELRREQVLSLNARGLSQQAIADKLGVSQATISLDLQYLMCKAQENLQTHIHETIPMQYQKCMSGLNQVLQTTWNLEEQTQDMKEKLLALGLIKDCYKYTMDLTSDSVTIKEAMSFVKKQLEDKKQEQEQEQEQQTAANLTSNDEEEENVNRE